MIIVRKLIIVLLVFCPLTILQGFVPPYVPEPEKLSKESLKREIEKHNFRFPDLIYRQAIIESGLNSPLAKKHNNIFGMFHPVKRHTTSKGKSKNGYATYESWQESVRDRYIYDTLFLKNHSRDNYLSYLERVYCGFPGYKKALLSVRY